MGKVLAPWTPKQVLALSHWQECGYVHEFTCRHGHKLIPEARGWRCSQMYCHYVQNWAHDFMLDGPPPHPFAKATP